MATERTGLIVLATLIGIYTGCNGPLDGGSCPEPGADIAVATGTFSTADFSSETDVRHPHVTAALAGTQKQIVIDRQTGSVRIRYQRDGKAIEEFWTIEGLR